MRRPFALAVAIVGVLVVGGCGEGSAAEDARKEQVEQIRAAAEAGDTEQARAETAELRALIEGQMADGEIDPGEAARVLAAVQGVETSLGPPPTEATTTTTTAPTTTTVPPPPPDDDDDDRGKGDGKGRDKDDDD